MALFIIGFSLIAPGCSQNNIDRGDVFTAVEQTLSKPGPVKDDLITRGLVTLPGQSENISNPAPSEIKIGEIEKLVLFEIYIIDEDGFLQFGPSYTPEK